MKVESTSDTSSGRLNRIIQIGTLPAAFVGFVVYLFITDGPTPKTWTIAGSLLALGIVVSCFVWLVVRLSNTGEARVVVDLDGQTATFHHMYVPREWFRVRPEPEFTISFDDVRYAYIMPGTRGAPASLQIKTDRGTVGIPETMSDFDYLSSVFQTLGEPDRRPWWTYPWKIIVVAIVGTILMIPLTWVALEIWLGPLLAD